MSYRTLSAPLSIQVELTEDCTHLCRHCYCFFRQNGNCQHKSLSREQLKILVEEIKKNVVHYVTITGGEPLMELENLLFFAKELQQIPWLSISLNSNLVLMTEEIAQKLLSVGIKGVLTSLMADTPELNDYIACRKGIWQKTVNGIKIAKQAGMRVMANMVLTKWNIDRVYQTGKFVHSLGVDAFSASRACSPVPLVESFHKNLISIDEIRESLNTLYKLKDELGLSVDILTPYPWCIISDIEKYQDLARRKCNAGVTHAQIGPDGQVRPCGHSARCYGSVFEDGLAGCFAKMAEWREQKFSAPCKQCKFFTRCAGGCTVELENATYQSIGASLCEEDVSQLPASKPQNIKIVISPDDELSFFSNTGMRSEEFGGTVFAKNGGIVHLDGASFEIVRNLQGKTFSARQVAQESDFELEKLLVTFSRWYHIKLLKKGSENHE